MIRTIGVFFRIMAMTLLPITLFYQGDASVAAEQTVLEKFNDLELFFAETKTRNIKIIKDRINMKIGKFTDDKQIQPDGKMIRNFKLDNGGFKEEYTREDSPLELHAEYDKNGVLETKYVKLYGFDVDDTVLYEKNGKIKERYPSEPDYKFTIKQLRQKLVNEYQIDLFNNRQVRTIVVNKFGVEKRPCYLVFARVIPSEEERTEVNTYLFDGVTGEFLYGLKGLYFVFGGTQPLNTWQEFKKHEKQIEKLEANK